MVKYQETVFGVSMSCHIQKSISIVRGAHQEEMWEMSLLTSQQSSIQYIIFQPWTPPLTSTSLGTLLSFPPRLLHVCCVCGREREMERGRSRQREIDEGREHTIARGNGEAMPAAWCNGNVTSLNTFSLPAASLIFVDYAYVSAAKKSKTSYLFVCITFINFKAALFLLGSWRRGSI